MELLRIVSMLLIIAHHFALHGPWPDSEVLTNDIMIDVISFGGKLGVNCFVLITGYFMVGKQFKCLSFLRVFLQVAFYGAIIYLVFLFFDPSYTAKYDLKHLIFPIQSSLYWFPTCYLALYLIIPVLNKLIAVLNRMSFHRVCVIGFVLFSLLPTLTTYNPVGSNFVWFMYLYCVGAFVRIHCNAAGAPDTSLVILNPVEIARTISPGVVLWVSIAIVWLYAGIGNIVLAANLFPANPRYLMGQNSIPIVYASICMLILFGRLNIGSLPWVNRISSTTFGIYLLHDNPLTRSFLWKRFDFLYYCDAIGLLASSLFVVIGVFVVCSLFDGIRIALLERPLFSKLKKFDFFSRVDRYLNFESASKLDAIRIVK